MKYLVAIFAALLFVSCSVKKRTYRDGYYMDWAFKKKVNTPKRTHIPSEDKKSNSDVVALAVKNKEVSEGFFRAKIKNTLLIDTCGDIITFKSGDQITAKVIEITEEKIKYKRCDNLDGPSFVVSKANVSSIRYTNGVEEKIVAPVQQTPQTTNQNTPYNPSQLPYLNQQKRFHPKAISASLIFILTFWTGLGIIISLIIAIGAKKEIKAKPDVYRGMGMANTVIILDCIFIGLILLALLLA